MAAMTLQQIQEQRNREREREQTDRKQQAAKADLNEQIKQQAQQQKPATQQPAAQQAATVYTPSTQVQQAAQQMQDAQNNKPADYTPSIQVQQAQNELNSVKANKPGTYTPNEQVQNALNSLNQLNASKPQGYESKYGAQLDNILQQIQNPQDFKYEFNGDELFKYYADDYTRRGKQASMDVMGQAAALTGGYGNSYAQQVGQQAYDEYLMGLYDKGMELRDRAYQKYRDDQTDLLNRFSTLAQQDATDYGRYRDTVGDWQNDRGYATDLYNMLYNQDYGQHRDTVGDWNTDVERAINALNTERNFDYNQYRDTVGDWQADRGYATDLYNMLYNQDYNQFADTRSYNEGVRQFNERLDWDKMSEDKKYAATWVMQILANGEMPSKSLLKAAGLSEKDAEKMMADLEEMVVAPTGGGGGNPSKPKQDTDNGADSDTSIKPKNLVGQVQGTAVALAKQPTTLEAKQVTGPVNTNLQVPTMTTTGTTQTAKQILENGITDRTKLLSGKKIGK